MENIILKKTIMRRVRSVYVLRHVINTITLKCVALLALVFGVASIVSVTDVLKITKHVNITIVHLVRHSKMSITFLRQVQ